MLSAPSSNTGMVMSSRSIRVASGNHSATCNVPLRKLEWVAITSAGGRQAEAFDHPAARKAVDRRVGAGTWRLGGPQPTHIHSVGQAYRQSSDLMIGPARGPDWAFIERDIPRDGMLTHPDLVSKTLYGLIG